MKTGICGSRVQAGGWRRRRGQGRGWGSLWRLHGECPPLGQAELEDGIDSGPGTPSMATGTFRDRRPLSRLGMWLNW